MKNLKVGRKIFIGFATVILMMVLMSATVVTTTLMVNDNSERIEAFSDLQTKLNATLDAVNLARIQANVIYNMMNQEANDKFAIYDADVKRVISEAASQAQSSDKTRYYLADIENFRSSYEVWSKNVFSIIGINDYLVNLGNQGVESADSVYQALRAFSQTRIENGSPAEQFDASLESMDKMATIRQGLAYIRDTFERSESENLKTSIGEVVVILENSLADFTDITVAKNTRDALKTCRSMQELIDTFVTENDDAWDFVDATIVLGETNTQMMNSLIGSLNANMNDGVDATVNLGQVTIRIALAVTLLSIAVAVVMGIIISGLISKPLQAMSGFLEYAGSTGDININPELSEKIERISSAKDEIGQMSTALAGFFMRIIDVSKVLESVSNGDLTAELPLLSDSDVMGYSLQKMLGNLNGMLHDLRVASNQVSSGSRQISQSAQSLASGSSEQSSNIEAFSNTLVELLEKTNHNAQNSKKAQDANKETGAHLEESINSMNQMLDAMKAIDESSGNITKVIKVIDDIAFQTNILALNAAVEAARAGQHGKGFAVVADEVRNLAAKSAEAAKETSMLIAGSSERVKTGNEIVVKTNTDLKSATENARESTCLIETVTTDSSDQARAISEVNFGIDQISSVVHANSALAEQSAAAAEEMASQSVALNEIVGRFTLKQDKTLNTNSSMISGTQAFSHNTGLALSRG